MASDVILHFKMYIYKFLYEKLVKKRRENIFLNILQLMFC